METRSAAPERLNSHIATHRLTPSSQDEDWLWIKNFQEGDPSAFEKIFNKYKVKVVNLAYHFVRQKEAAEDIAHDVFIKIYEKKFDNDPKAKFSTWLYRVTVNASLDLIRKKKFTPHSLDEPIQDAEGQKNLLLEKFSNPTTLPLQALQDEELKILVRREIEKLPENLKIPLLLYQFETLPYKEIAAVLRITEKAVEKRIYHAKDRLRRTLSKYYNSL